jgi:sugar/nucleoside kinase (ribokinase family)
VTAGTWCLDRNKRVDHWPQEDEIAEIVGEEKGGGGSGCNLAVDVKRLDPAFPVATMGLVGDDEDGRFLIALADAHEIDRTQLWTTRAAPTHYTDAYASRRSGRRTHITCRGTADLLNPDHFNFAPTSQRILHLGLPGVHQGMDAPWGGEDNGWVATLKKARAEGLQTNMELPTLPPETLRRLVLPCLPYLDLLIINDNEMAALADRTAVSEGRTDVGACIVAARKVLAKGAMQLVVVHFPLGAVAVTREGMATVRPSLNVPPDAVVGANGAGDAFAAGFLYAFHEGWSLADALSLAHAAAAASLRAMSTSGAVEPWPRCLGLAGEWGWRAEPR